jgi:aerobic-type carbon monoxide dehydrogenase small subunit (CoxS/CutS family)
MAMKLELQVNGIWRSVAAEPGSMLLSVLRDQLDLTGTKYGCGEGQCGACTVLVDGQPVRSCITRAEAVAGKSVTTIEGLERDGRLHPLQEAFLGAGAMQCGYCTAGMIVEGVALLRSNSDPNETQIKQGLEGHICRCGTYPRIVAAVRMASLAMREARHD